MESLFRALSGGPEAGIGISVAQAIVFVAAGYFFIALDRQRATSVNKDDTQVGLKLVLCGLLLGAIWLTYDGVLQLVSYILGGFKGGVMPVRVALPTILVGGGAAAGILFALMPRTNAQQFPQATRFLLGLVALIYGIFTITGVNGVVTGVFLSSGWSQISSSLSLTVVSGAFALFALRQFGALSGWVTPPPRAPAAPPPSYPPQGGYPPPGGGYPPQGGSGYGPPQGGGGG